MNLKKLLILAGLVGICLLGVGVIAAQDTATPQPDTGALHPIQDVVQIVADATGLELSEIRTQMQQGQTLAQIIEANGTDVNVVIDQAVAKLTEDINTAVANGQITQERATSILSNLKDVVTQGINGELFPNGLNRNAVRRQAEAILLRAAADATGLTIPNILEQLGQGKTLADVITANGGSVDTVVNTAVANATEQINTAVSEGRLGQEQANALISNLPTRFNEAVNGQFRQQAVRAAVSLALVQLAAQETGLRPVQIMRELRSDTPLAQILTDNGVQVSTFIDAAVAEVQARVNQAVKNGRITQAQADERVTQFRQTLTDRLNQSSTVEPTAASA